MGTHIIHADAGHDKNGNPRRAFIVLGTDKPRRIYDEGYKGSRAIPDEYRAASKTWTELAITPAQYRALIAGISTDA